MSESIEFHAAGEWTAVYVDGKLERVGDHYLADERLRARVGVVEVDDDAFMQGGDQRDAVAQTLEEVARYARARANRLERAATLRERAQQMIDEAAGLEKTR